MMRLLAFILILLFFQFVPWYMFAVAAIGYAFRWHAYELIVLGVMIDAFYGVHGYLPYYTLAAGLSVMLLEWLKPQLLFYTKEV